MSAREFDPSRLDVAAFAKEGATLEGRWPLGRFDRVLASEPAEAAKHEVHEVAWRARGERRAPRAGEPQTWLHLHATTRVPLECQRCLKPVVVPVQIERSFLFVHGEDAAAQLDAAGEDDVLAITRALDLRELIEDEILLALPIVPRHEVCPDPLVAPAEGDAAGDAVAPAPHPFAALAGLKRGKLN
jgi:uncharacterized protein